MWRLGPSEGKKQTHKLLVLLSPLLADNGEKHCVLRLAAGPAFSFQHSGGGSARSGKNVLGGGGIGAIVTARTDGITHVWMSRLYTNQAAPVCLCN